MYEVLFMVRMDRWQMHNQFICKVINKIFIIFSKYKNNSYK